MPKGKKKATEETPKAAPKKVSVKAPSFSGVAIFDETGQYVRTYNKDDHGPDFANMADRFIEDRPGYRKDIILD